MTIIETISQAEKLLNESKDFFILSEFDKSERCAKDTLDLLLPFADRDDLGDCLDESSIIYAVIANIAHAYNRLNTISDSRGDYHQAIEYGTTAISYCERAHIQWRIGNLYGNIGGNYANMGNYEKALAYLNKAVRSAEERGDDKLVATWLLNTSIVYKFIGDLQQALEIMSRIQKITAQTLDLELGATSSLAMGQIYFDLGNYQLALEYYNNALSYFKATNSKQDIAIVLINMGIVYDANGEYETALKYMKESLAINEEIQSKAYTANCLGNIGDVYIRTGNYSEAIAYLKKSLHQAQELNDKRQQAHCIYGLGIALSKMNKDSWDEGEQYLQKAITLSLELGILDLEARCRRTLSDLMSEQHRWEESAAQFRMYHDLERKIQSEKAVEQIQQLENRRKVEEAERDRQHKIAQHEVTVQLLHKTLPPSIAERLMNGEKNIADKFESASILFADIVGFTPISARTEPRKMVELLNTIFTRFDKLTIEHQVERIKTIGDAYMVVAGAPERCVDHAERMARFALAMIDEAIQFSTEVNESIQFRVGINSGEIVGAVVGESKFAYDVWGDAVNTAARMESHGESGRIHVSEEFVHQLAMNNAQWTMSEEKENQILSIAHCQLRIIPREEMEIKGKGTMRTFFLEKT